MSTSHLSIKEIDRVTVLHCILFMQINTMKGKQKGYSLELQCDRTGMACTRKWLDPISLSLSQLPTFSVHADRPDLMFPSPAQSRFYFLVLFLIIIKRFYTRDLLAELGAAIIIIILSGFVNFSFWNNCLAVGHCMIDFFKLYPQVLWNWFFMMAMTRSGAVHVSSKEKSTIPEIKPESYKIGVVFRRRKNVIKYIIYTAIHPLWLWS